MIYACRLYPVFIVPFAAVQRARRIMRQRAILCDQRRGERLGIFEEHRVVPDAQADNNVEFRLLLIEQHRLRNRVAHWLEFAGMELSLQIDTHAFLLHAARLADHRDNPESVAAEDIIDDLRLPAQAAAERQADAPVSHLFTKDNRLLDPRPLAVAQRFNLGGMDVKRPVLRQVIRIERLFHGRLAVHRAMAGRILAVLDRAGIFRTLRTGVHVFSSVSSRSQCSVSVFIIQGDNSGINHGFNVNPGSGRKRSIPKDAPCCICSFRGPSAPAKRFQTAAKRNGCRPCLLTSARGG